MPRRDRTPQSRVAAFALLAVLGCGDDASTPLPDDVDAVLESRCRRCHGRPTANFAPMSMIDWEDVQAEAPSGGDSVYEVMFRRLTSEMFPMPPARTEESAQMTDAERQTLLSWIAAGAPPKQEPAQ